MDESDVSALGEVSDVSESRAASHSPEASEASVIVGLDGREHDADALALGRFLQAALGGELLLAHVIPPAPPGRGMLALESLERQDGRELLARSAEKLGAAGVDTQLVEPCPAAPGLSRLAVERRASMLVLGSTHRGAVGRVVPGGVASHLLARAPCAIAVAPVRYVTRTHASISRIGVAYDATPESDLALAAAAGAAVGLGIPLRLYHAMHEISRDPAWDKFRGHMEDFAREILDAGIGQLPSGLEATGSVLAGDVAEVIAEAAASDDVALLYVGSRGYGPLREAVFGGVAGGLLQTARCPLVIVPRSSRSAVDHSSRIAHAQARA